MPDKDYGRFLREGAAMPDRPGEIVTVAGQVVGSHNGIQYFTIGQREGLNLGGMSVPHYVVALEPSTNRVIVGPREGLMQSSFEVANCNWLGIEEPSNPVEVVVKIRYNHAGCPATVTAGADGTARIALSAPERAITPGQAAVFYQGDLVVGGGWIC